MELAYMRGKNIDRDGIDTFRGINRLPRIADGEFRDMENMRGDEYPCIVTRPPRAYLRDIAKPNGLCANGRLAWVDVLPFGLGARNMPTRWRILPRPWWRWVRGSSYSRTSCALTP